MIRPAARLPAVDVPSLLDPEIAAQLPLLPPLGSLRSETLAAARARQIAPEVQLSDDVERSDHVVQVDPEVVIRVHRPKSGTGPLPCVYSIHGGGYVMGSRATDDPRLDRWCTRLGCVGVSVEYRLAPETPFPGPLEDCYAGLRWVHEHAADLGVDPDRVAVSGASAGGGLAAALALLARDRAELPVACQLLIYPMVDDRRTSVSSGWEVPVWDPASNRFGWQCYLGSLFGGDDVPYHAAPSRCEDLAGLPPAYVCVGTLDGFVDEDIDYAVRLNHAGVRTELHVYAGAPHGFDTMLPGTTIARRCRREATDWLARQLGV